MLALFSAGEKNNVRSTGRGGAVYFPKYLTTLRDQRYKLWCVEIHRHDLVCCDYCGKAIELADAHAITSFSSVVLTNFNHTDGLWVDVLCTNCWKEQQFYYYEEVP